MHTCLNNACRVQRDLCVLLRPGCECVGAHCVPCGVGATQTKPVPREYIFLSARTGTYETCTSTSRRPPSFTGKTRSALIFFFFLGISRYGGRFELQMPSVAVPTEYFHSVLSMYEIRRCCAHKKEMQGVLRLRGKSSWGIGPQGQTTSSRLV